MAGLNPILMPLICYSSRVRRTFSPPVRPPVLSWRASSFLSFVINLHIIINSQRIDECAWSSPGITPQIKEISTDEFFCFLLGDEWVAEKFVTSFVIKLSERSWKRQADMPMRLTDSRFPTMSDQWDILFSYWVFHLLSVYYALLVRSAALFRVNSSFIHLLACPDDISILYCNPPRYFQFLPSFMTSSLGFFDICIATQLHSEIFVGSGNVFGRGYKLKYRIGVQQWSFDSGTLWNWLIFHLIWVLCECLIYYSGRVEWLTGLEAKQYRT